MPLCLCPFVPDWEEDIEQQQMTHAVDARNLADILERVLDKGIVIAGDIRIQVADIDLLTIKIQGS